MNIKSTPTYDKWLRKQTDNRLLQHISRRLARIEIGLFGDVKSVGSGVFEIRIEFGQGIRIYYTQKGNEIVILLCAGDKSTQQRDIDKAIELAEELKP